MDDSYRWFTWMTTPSVEEGLACSITQDLIKQKTEVAERHLAEAQEKSVGKGKGLKLTIGYHIIAEHQDTFKFRFQLGKGTSVIKNDAESH